MPYHWQTSWGVQKIKWSFCKRIEFSPLRSIVRPVILFVSEWRGKVAPTTSTSVALIVILRGALGRVFCSWWKSFKLFLVLVLMSQSQNWNSSFWQEERDAHICPNCIFLCGLFSHPSATHPWSVLADGYFKTRKEKNTCCHTTVLYHGIFRCPSFTSGVFFNQLMFWIVACLAVFE